MIQGNFTGDSTVVTDALYRYDLNQKLKIYNSGLTSAPAVHFANKKSAEALVVQSTISGGIITVDIPNQLLEMPFEIVAFVYTEVNNVGTTVDKIRIPVIDRPKPMDYQYSDNITIMTYGKIEADIVAYFNRADKKIDEVDARLTKADEAEATARKEADANLKAQIDAIVIGAAEDAVASVEVAQARTDLGGNAYPTLKDRLDSVGIFVGSDGGIYQAEENETI
jgi:hypothetical protein